MERMLISGVTSDKSAARIALIGLKNEPGIAFKIFNLLSKKNINVDIIVQSIGRDDTKDISFTVNQSNLKEAMELLEENKTKLTAQRVEAQEGVAKVSIVGAGMQTNAGVAAGMFEALYGVGVNIRMISTSDIRITVLVDEDKADKAVAALHDKFIPEE